jgi:hypothetical protein
MVRPASFEFNAETAVSNAFQKNPQGWTPEDIREKAIGEFDAFVEKLRANNIRVTVVQDTVEPPKPDAIFPNNWISMQSNGTVYLYPMTTQNRRLERRDEILEELENKFKVKQVVDISDSENEGQFLEGTGSIIFDHVNKIGYACISPRTDKDLFIAHCEQMGYGHIYFHSADKNGDAIYHTNVMLTICDGFAVVCLESIHDESERQLVKDKLRSTDHEIVEITEEQMNNFAGNMLQVENDNGQPFVVMSESAFNSLTELQIEQIEKYSAILMVSIPTIETVGGGSARCMMAEVYLEEK